MTMIECVARAIAGAQRQSDWQQCLESARAAVAALREPSEDMLFAALPDCPDWSCLREDWGTMITFVANEHLDPCQPRFAVPAPAGKNTSQVRTIQVVR